MSLKLENLEKTDLKCIYNITKNINVMKNVGSGKIWNIQKTKKFLEDCLTDTVMSVSARNYFCYKIMLDSTTFIGIVYVRKNTILHFI